MVLVYQCVLIIIIQTALFGNASNARVAAKVALEVVSLNVPNAIFLILQLSTT
jgi:hypothetical protein